MKKGKNEIRELGQMIGGKDIGVRGRGSSRPHALLCPVSCVSGCLCLCQDRHAWIIILFDKNF